MQISVEISMYPLRDEFIPAISDFIEVLNRSDAVEVKTNSMSTQLFGEFDQVMALLQTGIKYSFERYGKVVFATKFLHGDTRLASGYE